MPSSCAATAMILYYQVLRNAQLLSQGEIQLPLQIGRQNESATDLKPVCVNERGSERRLVIASISADLGVPRSAVAVSESGSGFAVAKPQSANKEPVAKPGGERMVPASTRTLLVRHI